MTRTLPTLTADELLEGAYGPEKTANDNEEGFGALRTEKGCLPLRALDVRARLDGLVGRVDVEQAFVNAHDVPLEATYVFPLPDRAAVTSFQLVVAGRVVEGQLQERGAARQEYDRAIKAGHRAAIAEEERAGVFTMRVGNLPPGEEARVRLRLVGPLPYRDGEVTFRFPLVVAPRYVPGTPLAGDPVGTGVAPDTDAAPDASRISPPVLLPGFPNPVRLRLTVEVPPSALAPHDFRSSLHALAEDGGGPGQRFSLLPGERLDRDFVLRYRLGADRVGTALTVQPDAQGDEGTFLLTVVPPSRGPGAEKPRDIVFVLDRSGSMAGWKMVTARRAVERMVETLTERDRFAVYAFDDSIEPPPGLNGTRLVPATDRRRFRAAEFLAKVEARGGTEMAAPLDLALTELTTEPRREAERVLVLITDGQVANEDQMLRQLGARLRGVRCFALGIDRAVNAAFLRRLADLGGGTSEVVESEERLDEVMGRVHRHLGTPVLTGLSLRPAGLGLLNDSVVPGRLPDLFAGAPLLISGRYRGAPEGALALRAADGAGESWSTEVRAWREDGAPLAAVWARGRVRELEDRYAVGVGDQSALEKEIVRTSLRFGVLCRFTAYVAVDRSAVVNEGGQVHSVVQPVEQPEGWAEQAASVVCGAVPQQWNMMRSLGAAPAPTGPAPACAAPPPAPCAPADMDFDVAGFDAEEEAQTFRGAPPPRPAGAAPRRARRDEAEKYDRARRAEPPAEPEEREGLLGRLRGLFGGRSKDKKAAPVAQAPLRPRVEALLQRLESGPADTLALLREVFAELEALFKDLARAGDRAESVKRLGEGVERARALLAQAGPDPAAAAALLRDLAAALRNWLGLPAPAEPPAQREGFWK
jgi:Ca-activated chloride channel family protein